MGETGRVDICSVDVQGDRVRSFVEACGRGAGEDGQPEMGTVTDHWDDSEA